MDSSNGRREVVRRHVPKQARAQQRATKILGAARAELAKRTPAEIRTEDIAARAEVPIGSLYHYFGSKDALLAAVAESVVAEADEVVSGLLAECTELPWRDAVDKVVNATFDFYLREDFHYRVLLRSIRHTGEFAEITAASNARSADLFSRHPAFDKAGISPERALSICHVLVTAGNALQDHVLVEDDLDIGQWRIETALVLKQYLSAYVP